MTSAHDFVQRAKGLIARRQHLEAVKVCRLGLLSHPSLLDGRLILGQALLELGRFDEVLAEMRVALDLSRESAAAHLLRGEAFLRKGDVKQAEESLLTAQTLDPHNERVDRLLGEARRTPRGGKSSPAAPAEASPADFGPLGAETKLYPATADKLNEFAEATVVSERGDPTAFGEVDPRLLEASRARGEESKVHVSPELVGEDSLLSLDAIDLGGTPAGGVTVDENTGKGLVHATGIGHEDETRLGGAAMRRVHDEPTVAMNTGATGAGVDDADMDEVIEPPDDPSAIRLDLRSAVEVKAGQGRRGRGPGVRSSGSIVELDPDDSAVQLLSGDGDSDVEILSSEDLMSPLPIRADPSELRPRQQATSKQKAIEPKLAPKGPSPGLRQSRSDADTGDETSPEKPQGGKAPGRAGPKRPEPEAPGRSVGRIKEIIKRGDDDDLESTTPQGVEVRPRPAPGKPVAKPAAAPPAATPDDKEVRKAAALAAVAHKQAAAEARAKARGDEPAPGAPKRPETGEAGDAEAPAPRKPPAKAGRPVVEPRAGKPVEPTGRTRSPVKPRRGRRRGSWSWWQLMVVVGAVSAAGVIAGLFVRSARMRKQLARLRADAQQQLSHGNLHDFMAAEKDWANVISLKSDVQARSARARVVAAMAAEFGEKPDSAEKLVADLGKAGNAQADAARTYLAIASGRPGDAVALARAAAHDFPDDSLSRYLLGRAVLATGDAEQASSLLEIATQHDAGDILAWRALGVARVQRGQLDAAGDAFQHALSIWPNHIQTIVDAALLAIRRGDKDSLQKAQQDLESVINSPPDQASRAQLAWAEVALAELRAKMGEAKRARDLLASAAEKRPQADPAFDEALASTHLVLGDEAAARSDAERVLKAEPNRLVSRRILAEISLEEDRPQAALDQLASKGTTSLAFDPEAMVLRGRAYLALGDIDNAARELDDALAKTPGDTAAKVARARVDLARGQAAAAVTALRPLYQDDPQSGDVAAALASALRAQGTPEATAEALKILSSAADRGGVPALIELARLHRSQGRLGDARAALLKALDKSPHSREAKLEDALVRFDSGDAHAAAQALAQLAKDPSARPLELLWATRAAVAVGELSSADDFLARLSQGEALKGEVARERGRLALAKKTPSEAVTELRRAVSLVPTDVDARVLLVDALLAANDVTGADAALRDARSKLKSAPELDVASAHVELLTGKFQLAIKAAGAGLRVFEAHNAPPRVLADAHLWLGRGYYDDGQLSHAAPEFQEAGRLDPSDAQAFYYLGLSFDELGGQPEQARQSFQKAAQADPNLAESYYWLGDLARRQNNVREAKKSLDKYLSLAPKGDYADEARRLLGTMKSRPGGECRRGLGLNRGVAPASDDAIRVSQPREGEGPVLPLCARANGRSGGCRAYQPAAAHLSGGGAGMGLFSRLAGFRAASTQIEVAGGDALDALIAVAEAGDRAAQRTLGEGYLEREQHRDALKWLRLAAAQNDPRAMFLIAEMFEDGRGESANLTQALAWYAASAGLGYASAQHCLATMFAHGRGVGRDDVTAVGWYAQAAEQGHAGAAYSLGLAYRKGLGVAADDDLAVRWFRRAAEQGHARAQRELAVACAEPGPQRSDVEAYMWAMLAGRTDDSAERLGRVVAARLSEHQLGEAARMARAWTAARERPQRIEYR